MHIPFLVARLFHWTEPQTKVRKRTKSYAHTHRFAQKIESMVNGNSQWRQSWGGMESTVGNVYETCGF